MRYIILQNGDQIFADISVTKAACVISFPENKKLDVFAYASTYPHACVRLYEKKVILTIPTCDLLQISEEYKNDKYEIKPKNK